MDELLSEKEQIDKMRAWWSDNGNYVLAGIVLGAGALFGWNYFQDTEREAELNASAMYKELTDFAVDGPFESAVEMAARLDAEYPDSAYATQAKLAMARQYMDQNRDQDAADALSSVLDSSADDAFKHIARVRLGRILLYQDKADEALALVSGQDASSFMARYAELRGDAYVMKGEYAEAAEAYKAALSDPQQASSIDAQLVQLKLTDLPVAPVVAAVEEEASE